MGERTYNLTALTDIWTGSVQLKEKNGQLREEIVPNRLITTGLLGSIRWWFEVVVRGLGGAACDPTRDDNRCPSPGKDPTDAGHHCVVCELFGCTGWARKFRFDVLDGEGKPKQDQIKANQSFQLRFTPLRPIDPEEWALLDLTLRLIAEYGAIGGRTVYKPTEEASRQSKEHHQDFGLVKVNAPPTARSFTEEELQGYVSQQRWRRVDHGSFDWASLHTFWCVSGKHLSRQDADHSSFNRVLGRNQSKMGSDQNPTGNLEKWLAGGRVGGCVESKKVFSFKNPKSARRTFGFVRPTDKLGEMRERLKKKKAWPDLKDDEFLEGGKILRKLLGEGGSQ